MIIVSFEWKWFCTRLTRSVKLLCVCAVYSHDPTGPHAQQNGLQLRALQQLLAWLLGGVGGGTGGVEEGTRGMEEGTGGMEKGNRGVKHGGGDRGCGGGDGGVKHR